jgi:hypothetical protein
VVNASTHASASAAAPARELHDGIELSGPVKHALLCVRMKAKGSIGDELC